MIFNFCFNFLFVKFLVLGFLDFNIVVFVIEIIVVVGKIIKFGNLINWILVIKIILFINIDIG